MAFCEGAEADMHMYFDKAGKYDCYDSCIVSLMLNWLLVTQLTSIIKLFTRSNANIVI